MFEQPADFKQESDALYELLAPLDDDLFSARTQFKGWAINDVLKHLHTWNWAAKVSLTDPETFSDFRGRLFDALGAGRSLGDFERDFLDTPTGPALRELWREFYEEMTECFAAADPKARVAWAGPDMSVRSSITARLMETWAHGQEIYDLLGVERVDGDRIKNIAVLGVNTFKWTFVNRGLEPPANPPHVRLTSPSGQTWTWNDASNECSVRGTATEFCQVVTQVRALADTGLEVVGDSATRWMSIAQCFAGPAEDPPAPGTRFRAGSRS